MARPRPKHSNRRFVDELPELLRERGVSIRALARRTGISQSHLSRVLRQSDYKTPSRELLRRVAVALELPPDYWPEYREAVVIERLRSDPALRDRIYGRLKRG